MLRREQEGESEKRRERECVEMDDEDHRFCLVTATELLSHLVSVPVLQLMVQPVSPAGRSDELLVHRFTCLCF